MLVFRYYPTALNQVCLFEVEFDGFGTGIWIEASYFLLGFGARIASIAVIQRELRGWSAVGRKELRLRLRQGLDLMACKNSVLGVQLDLIRKRELIRSVGEVKICLTYWFRSTRPNPNFASSLRAQPACLDRFPAP